MDLTSKAGVDAILSPTLHANMVQKMRVWADES